MKITTCDNCTQPAHPKNPDYAMVTVIASGKTTHFCSITCMCKFVKNHYPGEFK